MTAPNGPILFNSSTGSDTQASGLGPATAVFGSGASTTAASAVVTGIDTTGVSAGDLLWVQSSSGRQFSIIASVDSGTQVTCDDTFANTEGSRTWAIGGKRASFANASSYTIFTDAKPGFIIEMEDGYTETLTAAINFGVAGTVTSPITLRGAEGATTKPKLTWSTALNGCFGGAFNYLTFDNFVVANTNASKTEFNNCFRQLNRTGYVYSRIDVDPVNHFGVCIQNTTGNNCIVRDCNLVAATGTNCRCIWISDYASGLANVVRNRCTGGQNAIRIDTGTTSRSVLKHNIVSGSSAAGIFVQNTTNTVFVCEDNVIHGSGGDGIYFEDANPDVIQCSITGNIISGSGGYAINANEALTVASIDVSFNAFYNNTSGNQSSFIPTGLDDIALTADPFTNAAGGDFSLNNVAGGGLALSGNYKMIGLTKTHPFGWLGKPSSRPHPLATS